MTNKGTYVAQLEYTESGSTTIRSTATITLASVATITSVKTWYYLGTMSNPPTKPTTNPPGVGWTATEPTFDPDNPGVMYTSTIAVYDDETFSWSDVTTSSSYQAAITAYNEAVAAGATGAAAQSAADQAQQDAQEAMDTALHIQVGGRNLLNGTSEDMDATTEDTPLGTNEWVDLSNEDADYVTLRAYIEPVEGDWNLELRILHPGGLLCGEAICGEALCGGTYDTYRTGEDPDTGWTTLTVELEDTNCQVAAFLVGTGDPKEVRYHSAKLETGNRATHWTPSEEEVEERINAAQATADDAQERITTIDTRYASAVQQLNNKISMTVQASDYDQDQALVNQRIGNLELTSESMSVSVRDIQKVVGTVVTVDTEALHLKQDQNSKWEAQLTANSLDFLNTDTGTKAASFGVDGAYADRLRSNKTLSVGTEDDGWFDFTAMSTGMAEKWRDSQSVNRPEARLFITEQPVDGHVAWNATAIFRVTAENVAAYQWQWRYILGTYTNDVDGWANLSGETSRSLEITCSENNLGQEFRCVLESQSGEQIVASEIVRVYCIDAPVIIRQPPAVLECTANIPATFRIAVIGDVSQYIWQSKPVDSGSWTSDTSTGQTAVRTKTLALGTDDFYERCIVRDALGNEVVSRAIRIGLIG